MEEPGGSGARITKMKDGTTHLAHKAEHAVDLSSGALLAITLQPASEGDTSTIQKTLEEAQSIVDEIRENGVEEVVADKGYHSGEVLKDLHDEGVRTYIPEPDRGPRHWEGKAVEQQRTYENRRRVRGNRGKRLQKTRSELTERSFAHMYDTGGMRRVHLRGRDNILKRLLVQGAAFNLSLILRKALGAGKPRQLPGFCGELFAFFARLLTRLRAFMEALDRISHRRPVFVLQSSVFKNNSFEIGPELPASSIFCRLPETAITATGC
jgi:transposase